MNDKNLETSGPYTTSPGSRVPGSGFAHITPYSTYAAVWLLLLLLTLTTIAVARLHFTQFAVLISLAIAACKTLLVAAFFMHLRYEGTLLKGFILLGVLALTVIIGLTFVDVWYRP
jgi:cytochrome c oxidase subunit 4